MLTFNLLSRERERERERETEKQRGIERDRLPCVLLRRITTIATITAMNVNAAAAPTATPVGPPLAVMKGDNVFLSRIGLNQ